MERNGKGDRKIKGYDGRERKGESKRKMKEGEREGKGKKSERE